MTARAMSLLSQFARGARGINRDYCLQTELADQFAALAQRMHMAVDRLDFLTSTPGMVSSW